MVARRNRFSRRRITVHWEVILLTILYHTSLSSLYGDEDVSFVHVSQFLQASTLPGINIILLQAFFSENLSIVH